jgi:Fic family protein
MQTELPDKESVLISIDKMKAFLDAKRPLSKLELEKIMESFNIEQIYNSNAIEGNTLSLPETKMVIQNGLTINNKKVKDHLEAINLHEAVNYVEHLVETNEPMTERVVKDVHFLILKGMEDGNRSAGVYRSIGVAISGSTFTPPQPYLLQKEMESFFLWYEDAKSKLHPVELAARFHQKLVNIHPFIDGNGRTCRLLMNLVLMQNGYLPVIVKADKDMKQAYYHCLQIYHEDENNTDFIVYVAECEEISLLDRLELLSETEEESEELKQMKLFDK